MRSLLRFSLATLFALMLLSISVAGWWRDRQGDAREQAALDAIAKENVGVRITRRSEVSGRGSAGSANGGDPGDAAGCASGGTWSSFAESLTERFHGKQDPIVTLMIEQIPSDATRKKVLDLPYLERLWIFGNDFSKKESLPEQPTVEAILGRSLPELPPAVELPEEPPPLPRGTKLSDEAKKSLLRQIAETWKERPRDDSRPLLRYVSSDDPQQRQTIVARSGSEHFRLEWMADDRPGASSTRLWVVAENKQACVQRRWENGAWRLEVAARSMNDQPVRGVFDDFPVDERPDFLGLFFGQTLDLETAIDEAELLEEGGYLLRRTPGSTAQVEGFLGRVEEGSIVVGPAPDYSLRRSDLALSSVFITSSIQRTDLFEHDADAGLPLRQSTWLRSHYRDGAHSSEESKKRLTRFAWESDPELPADLFSPSRQGQDFFTAEPPPPFRWWYATAGLSAAAFIAIAATNVRRLMVRRSSRARRNGSGDWSDVSNEG